MGKVITAVLAANFLLIAAAMQVSADEFNELDLALWKDEYEGVVQRGRAAFVDPSLGKNGVVCAQCHPNAANTHPETYPKFQKQLGKVAVMAEMINWCILNPLEGEPLALDDPKMIALQAYISQERRGVELVPGKH